MNAGDVRLLKSHAGILSKQTSRDLFISSPEHVVLMESYCDRSMSLSIVRRASSVVNKMLASLSPGELKGWEASVVCPSSVRRLSTLSKDFSSETAGPNVTKFNM